MHPTIRDQSGVEPDRRANDLLHPGPSSSNGRRASLYCWLLAKLLADVKVPLRILLWNGAEYATTPGRPVARIRIRDRAAFWRLLVNLHLGFGDGYSDGRIDVEGSLVELLEVLFRTKPWSGGI